MCKSTSALKPHFKAPSSRQRANHLLLLLPHLWVVDDGHDDEKGGDEDEQGRHPDEHLKRRERDMLIAV